MGRRQIDARFGRPLAELLLRRCVAWGSMVAVVIVVRIGIGIASLLCGRGV